MLHVVALTPCVPRVTKLPFRASLCIVTSQPLLLQACTARARDVVLVPTAALAPAEVRALRRAMAPDALLVAVAPTLVAATAAAAEYSLYDYVVSAPGLEQELAFLLANRVTLELVAASA